MLPANVVPSQACGSCQASATASRSVRDARANPPRGWRHSARAGRRHRPVGFLASGSDEPHGEGSEVIDQIADARIGTRRRERQLSVGDRGEQAHGPFSGWTDVDHPAPSCSTRLRHEAEGSVRGTPVKCAGRFSRNAVRPSTASPLAQAAGSCRLDGLDRAWFGRAMFERSLWPAMCVSGASVD